jgi:peptidoglycan/xylan/chitin deacetylase (PgdA/CDA1 family)
MSASVFARLRRLVPRRRRPLILMYHRVATPRLDPWDLAVSPDRFAAQLEVLRATRRVLPMADVAARADAGRLPSDAVAITFDDGYADTLHHAKPALAAAGLPATLFLATAFVGQRVEYWWDELARGILECSTAIDTEVAIGREVRRLRLPAASDPLAENAAWRAAEAPETPHQALYLDLWTRLRALSAAGREAAMTRLREALEIEPPADEDLPMTEDEVAALAADPSFAIGGHTATHPPLTMLPPEERRYEIHEGKQACERLVGRAVDGFAYPHGANDADARAAVAECGFVWACTTEARPLATREPDRYALPRLAVLDWDAATFERVLATAGR